MKRGVLVIMAMTLMTPTAHAEVLPRCLPHARPVPVVALWQAAETTIEAKLRFAAGWQQAEVRHEHQLRKESK